MADIPNENKPCTERRKMTMRHWIVIAASVLAMIVSGITIISATTAVAEQRVEQKMTIEKNKDMQKQETDAIRREQSIQYSNILTQMGSMQKAIDILQEDVKRILRRTE
jgi:hypothetical protein